MITTKSYSKNRFRAFFRPSMKSRLPFMITTLIMMILIIAVPYFVGVQNDIWRFSSAESLANYFTGGVIPEDGWQVMASLVLGILAFAVALGANSYMHSKNQTDFYHSLPLSRPQMLLTNMASSLLAIAAPYLAVHFFVMAAQQITYGAQGCFGSLYYMNTFLQLFTNLLYIFVIYAFTTFICVQVGTIFDSLAVSGIMGFIPMFLYGICGLLWQVNTYGAAFEGRHVLMLSPFTFTFERYVYYADDSIAPLLMKMGLWALLGAGFLAAAIVLYHRRRSEGAGQTQSQGVLQTIVKVFVAFCGATLFYVFVHDSSQVTKAVMMLLGGIGIGIISELILSRGVRNIVRNLKWLAAGSLLALFFQLGVVYDIIGYQTHVPNAEQVSSVFVTYNGRYEDIRNLSYSSTEEYNGGSYAYEQKWEKGLYDQESIREVIAAHRTAVAHIPNDSGEFPDHLYQSVNITYYLNGGKTVSRTYRKVFYEAVELLAELEDNRDFVEWKSPLFWSRDAGAAYNDHLVQKIGITDPFQVGPAVELERQEQTQRLLEALRSDILAEDIAELRYPSSPVAAHIEIAYRNSDIRMCMPVHGGYTETLGVLKELGILAELQSEERLPDKLYILPGNYGYFDEWHSRINTVRSFERYVNEQTYFSDRLRDGSVKRDELVEVSDSLRIRDVTAVSRGQLFLHSGAQNGTVSVVAEKDGVICGRLLAYIADLPDFSREPIERLQESGGADGYETYEDTVTPEPADVLVINAVAVVR